MEATCQLQEDIHQTQNENLKVDGLRVSKVKGLEMLTAILDTLHWYLILVQDYIYFVMHILCFS